MRRTWPRLIIAVAATLALISGCDQAAPRSASPAPAPQSTGADPVGTLTASRTPARPSASWPTDPVTVVHKPVVPPVPVLVTVRAAAHPSEGYDRIVFDFSHAIPGYSVRYVSEVRSDPADRPVTVPGSRYLLIVFTPAQAHENAGRVTVSGAHRLDLPVMRGYAVAGDFEGHVSVAIGLDHAAGFRVGELPQRIYIDVAE